MEQSLKLNRNTPFINIIFNILEGKAEGEEAIELFRLSEIRNKLRVQSIFTFPVLEELPEELYDEYVEGDYYDFITDTNFIVGACEYDKLEIQFRGKYKCTWSHRNWGAMQANWANKNNWLGKNNWGYLDFYAGPNDKLIKDYFAWSNLTMRIIRLKDKAIIEEYERRLEEFTDILNNDCNIDNKLDAIRTIESIGNKQAKKVLEERIKVEKDSYAQMYLQRALMGFALNE
jgi:hypothetical protein